MKIKTKKVKVKTKKVKEKTKKVKVATKMWKWKQKHESRPSRTLVKEDMMSLWSPFWSLTPLMVNGKTALFGPKAHKELFCQKAENHHQPFKTLPEAQRTQILTPWLGLNLATTWHLLHYLQFWPPDGATCISCKFGHQLAPFELVANLATRWRHLH